MAWRPVGETGSRPAFPRFASGCVRIGRVVKMPPSGLADGKQLVNDAGSPGPGGRLLARRDFIDALEPEESYPDNRISMSAA